VGRACGLCNVSDLFSPRRRVTTVAKALRESPWETLHARPICAAAAGPCLPEFGNVDLLEGAGREGVPLGEEGDCGSPERLSTCAPGPFRDLRSLGPARKRSTMHVTGQLPEGVEPFETGVRIEFHDEADGRTRLEVRQWLPEHLASPSEQGWLEAFTKLDATLAA
jgi:hypothetical protein